MLKRFFLKNSNGVQIDFLNFGGIVTNILAPDKSGTFADVVLGFNNANEYVDHNPSYFNALIGRVANRIGGAQFKIGGETYHLYKNDGENSLHGGKKGFDKIFWDVEELAPQKSYLLKYLSRDGEEGYPGNLSVAITYSLDDQNAFVIDYEATTDKATHVNLTQHCYFNLSGIHGSTALDHELMIRSSKITESDQSYIPTGKILDVDKLSDFRKPHLVGDYIERVHEGYNFNYVIDNSVGPVAILSHKNSGRSLEVYTTEPGLQFYSGYFLDTGITGKNGVKYPKYAGLALEAQKFPDACNRPQFPSTLIKPSETYRQTTKYKFGVL